jgi:hypothetical protein
MVINDGMVEGLLLCGNIQSDILNQNEDSKSGLGLINIKGL